MIVPYVEKHLLSDMDRQVSNNLRRGLLASYCIDRDLKTFALYE